MTEQVGRITLSMDMDWSFHLGEIDVGNDVSHGVVYGTAKAGACRGVPKSDFDARNWETVNLPHDWSVKRKFDWNGSPSWGYKPKGTAWYRKAFFLPEDYSDKELSITFEGVAKNAAVYFNGSVIYRNFTAYAPFTVDITDRAHFGDSPNVIAVHVDANEWEGWWYEGAGIYRHVRLDVKSRINIAEDGIFVKPEKRGDKWIANISAELKNCGYEDSAALILCKIFDRATGEQKAEYKFRTEISAYSSKTKFIKLLIEEPKLWDIDEPNLYTCEISVLSAEDETVLDNAKTDFGFRTIRFDNEKGFFLNGRNVKLFGTCNHQDHGGIGVAVPDSIHEYRIGRLKEMGCNAYRCAHGMPHRELLDACDRMGMLVMDENRSFETSEECLGQLRKMVVRDRNHPSVIMYSIFNEEPLQSSPEGARMARRMSYEIRRLDDSRFVTGAMNGGVLDDDGAVLVLDVAGANYQMWTYEQFHKKYPDRCFVGSETTSTFSVRDCYKTDMSRNEISCYDEDPAGWGNTVRDTWDVILKNEFAAGGFMWTGFDYLGEPTPFTYPSVSSFFGMMDICGFAKDGYYLCQAIFKDEPVVHVLPHWNRSWKEGEIVRVMSHTNCEEAELFVNGRSCGRQKIELTKQAYWNVPYEPGELKLVGYNGGKAVGEDVRVTAGEVYEVRLEPWRDHMYGGGDDAIPVNLVAYDRYGNEVTDAEFAVTLECEGGEILGTSNGDPNCHEEFTSNIRSLFHGKAQAVIRCNMGVKSLTLRAKCGNIKCNELCVKVLDGESKAYVPSVKEQYLTDWKMTAELSDSAPDPRMEFLGSDMNSLEPVSIADGGQTKFRGRKDMYALYRTRAVIPCEINGKRPTLHFNSVWGECAVYIGGELIGKGDGEWAYPLDCPIESAMTGEKEITVVVKSRNEYGAGICSSVVIR